MEEVIYYLELKNQYYEKFYSVTAKFLESARQNQWEHVEFFVDNRERILNIIRSFDFNIAKAFESLDLEAHDITLYRARVKELLDKRAVLAQKIVALDLELISRIDEVKTDTVKDLRKALESHSSSPEVPAAALPRRSLKSDKDA